MSGNEPIQPQRRELEIIRVLFDRQLSERAVALAETRWPGSGKMIELAYEWPELSPGDRRQRLSELGPEQTHRFRALATLHPDLQKAVDEMEQRGIFEEMQDAALDRVAPDESPSPSPEETPEAPSAVSSNVETQPQDPVERPDIQVETPEVSQQLDIDVERLDVDMPELDLGLPSTSEFLTDQNTRREASLKQAESMMERVHQRLTQSAERIMSRSSALQGTTYSQRTEEPPTEQIPASDQLGEGASEAAEAPAQLPDPDASSRMIEAPKSLTDRFRTSRVISLGDAADAPSDDELVALANELDVGLREYEIAPGRLREVFGGLQRQGSSIETIAGPLPSALADANLVVVRGRIHPKIVERMRDGWADIPGTRATVKMHDSARLLLIP